MDSCVIISKLTEATNTKIEKKARKDIFFRTMINRPLSMKQ